jgi:hypothetical protein
VDSASRKTQDMLIFRANFNGVGLDDLHIGLFSRTVSLDNEANKW